ncbi:MAG: helix-turn-helix domain-containing protein [Candidatus Nanoarchaeia archaeon]|nr:helix-turn-helix domain-containing protein [Candidatus Nanoarchaeia archaeon]MDD5740985.1 helix-turn-helix domain-containing protein [Candidatus Nanoarchaeia archaeon]
METEILEQIGLSKNEIKVYFALLELEQASATPIIKRANIPNSKLYPIIEKLIKRGLVSYVIKNNVKYFQASDPNNLINLLNEKEKQIIEQKQKIKEIIPQIEIRRKLAREKQEATIYEGLEGIRAAFDNILNTLSKGEEYLVFTLGEELGTEKLKTFFQNYHKKRIEKEIKVRLIADKKIKEIITKYHVYKGMRVRYTGKTLPNGIFIYDNNVMTVVWGDIPTAFVITSKNNSKKYKDFFEETWKHAKA